jgi:condensation domain-containing protein
MVPAGNRDPAAVAARTGYDDPNMKEHMSRRGPLCRAQYFEWWLSQRSSSRAVANVFIEIMCPGGITPQAAGVAVRLVLGRHDAFRTTFGLDSAGMPEQVVHPASDLPPVTHVVLDSLDGRTQVVRELTNHEFDISAELPVKAVIMSARASQGVFLLICCPHVVCDYHSMEIIRAEILTLLAHPRLDDSALQDRGPQPLDIAFEEALGHRVNSEITAARYWVQALSSAPLRNFWRSYDIDAEMYRAHATSHDAPVLLSRYALACGSTPSTVYITLIHIIMSLISSRTDTLVRFYFTGRPRRLENSVGPFHRELFSTVDISDSDTVSACVRKAAAVIMQARARYSLDYLSFREAEVREEARRGSAFAWGTIVNLVDTPEFRSRWRELPGSSAPMRYDDMPFSLTPAGSDVNERGMEVFLSSVIEPSFMSVTAEFNSMAIRPENAEILVHGPWDIVKNSLTTGTDAKIADLRKRYGLAPAKTRTGASVMCADDLHDTRAVLERFPGVLAAFLTIRPGRSPAELVAYVATDRPEIVASDLRDHVLETLKPATAIFCPGYFIICGAVPGDRTSERSWQAVSRLSEGTGINWCRLPRRTAQETALALVIDEVNGGESADLARSYVESGGSLLRVPAILQRLARAGFTGLRASDFEGHARLYQLARRLSQASAAYP